jgi:acyl-CoA synthetase (NDP forming)
MTPHTSPFGSPPADSQLAIDALLRPTAIAVVGASGREGNPFARPLQYLTDFGFEGAIYPINPNYERLMGLECYPDLESLPGPIALALLLIPADDVLRQIPKVAAAGARAAVVFASGFAEVADGGPEKQAELVRVAHEHGLRLIGPNCQGVLNVGTNMAATFTPALDGSLPLHGNIAYVGQSGAVGGSILSLARERGMGIAAWVSTGNQADLRPDELGTWLIEQPDVEVLTFYFESAPDPAAFAHLARRANELGKHIVVLQSGTSDAGARAALSHTGAILGSNAAFETVCDEYGVMRADDLEEFVTIAHAFSVLPSCVTRRVGIVTTSGGAGSLAADQLESMGLSVNELGPSTQAKLAVRVPAFGTVANPVDVTAQMFRSSETEEFGAVCTELAAASEIDAVVIILTLVTGEFAERMAHELVGVWRRSNKPVLLVWLASTEQTAAAREIVRSAGFPVLDSPRMAAVVLDALGRAPRRRDERVAAAVTDELLQAIDQLAGNVVTESGAGALLRAAGVATPWSMVATTAAAASNAAQQQGGPLVMKIQSESVLHKTELGGVRLDVAADQVAMVFEELSAAFADYPDASIMLQKQVEPGPELIVGITASALGLAPLITVGIGGTATELYADTVTRLSPVTADEAEQMVMSLVAAPLLTGFRGQPAYPIRPIAEAIERLSNVGVLLGDRLVDLEINPLRLTNDGPIALDALLTLQTPPPLDSNRRDTNESMSASA